MRIEFTTRDYEASHGRKPRGRGLWWFDIDGNEFLVYGTLTEAKKQCRQHIKETIPEGKFTVYVAVMP